MTVVLAWVDGFAALNYTELPREYNHFRRCGDFLGIFASFVFAA